MFFSVARLRHALLSFLVLSPASLARVDELHTSSVTYCAPPLSIIVDQFDVRYLASNNSVFFNISAASVEPNMSVTANLQLNVYGINPFNITIDLCTILGGVLCPLPQYNFQGSQWLSVPSSVNIAKEIPGIAYKIPDFEAFAQLTLTDVQTNELVACVQTTLSNGWSMRQAAVSWATGFLAVLALLSALYHTARRIVPTSAASLSMQTGVGALAPVRLLDLMATYQTIAISGLYALDYPVVYRAYTLNFAWAVGMFQSTSVQTSINTMRHKTGGHLADNNMGDSAVALVNRKLSPYNVFAASSKLLAKAAQLSRLNLMTGAEVAKDAVDAFARRDTVDVTPTVTPESNDVLQAGVPIWVNSIGIGTGNAFMTVFFIVLMILAVVLVLLASGWGLLVMLARRSTSERVAAAQRAYPRFAKAWGLRLALIIFYPVLVFGFYQWTLGDSWLSDLLAAITIVALLAVVFMASFRLIRRLRADTLFIPNTPSTSLAPLHAHLRSEPKWTLTFVAPLAALFVKALVVAFGYKSPMAQIVVSLVVEFLLLLVFIGLRPNNTKGGNVLSIYLAITRLVATGLLIAFVESIALAAIPRVAIGIVAAVALSIAVVVLFFSVVLNTGLDAVIRDLRSRSHRKLDDQSSHASAAEKAERMEEKKAGFLGFLPSASRKTLHDRPRNPTPEHNLRLGQAYLPPSPMSAPTSPSQGSEYSGSDSRTAPAGSSVPPPRRQYFPPSSASSESGYGSVIAEGGLFSGQRISQLSGYSAAGGQRSRRNSGYEVSRQPTVDEHGSVSEGETEDRAGHYPAPAS